MNNSEFPRITGVRSLKVEDPVQSRYYTNNKPKKRFGKLSYLYYRIKRDNGYI